jgi:putative copper export protein/mono/diheme cytochrome c family protein
MDILLIVARAVHFAGAISLAGVFGFVAFVVPRPSPELRQTLLRIGWISLVVVGLSAPLRLLFVAQSMTGDSLAETIARSAGWLVLTSTQFGHAALLRLAVFIALLPFIAKIGRRHSFDLVATALAAIGLAAIAWQGHAGADLGWDAVFHLAADTAHLVAAGLWLGALLPLALLLRESADARLRYEAARRFSGLGVACVSVLLVSGVVNAWYLVGSVPALFGTAYGQTLLFKLAVVAALLWLAAINRWRLVPRLASGNDGDAAQRLAHHAMIEAMLGLAVIAVVAVLGTMIPAAHESVSWPFAYRLSFDAAPALLLQAAVTAAVALLGLIAVIAGIWRRRGWAVIIGLAFLLGFGWRPIELLAVAATPTSYSVSAEPFAVPSIAAGSALYRQQCVSCHGEDGEGDGPLATELPIVPLDLAAPEVVARPDGDLFWSLTVGMAGGAMPSFAALDPAQRWDLIVYLKAQRQARASSSTLIAEVTVSPAPLAPDFVLPIPQDGAATLAALRAQGGVLLVFATLPQSQARLDQLQQWRDTLGQAGINVLTIIDAPAIRGVYAIYERRPQIEDEPPAAHIEFMIDRAGYIRARWRPGDTPDWALLPALQREIAAMARIKLTPVAEPAVGHVHEG